jgi:acetoin utilization protein AcuB
VKEQRVRDWMTPNPVTVTADTPLLDAHQLMVERKIRRLPVMKDGRLVGIITLGDVRGAQPSEATSLSVWEINYLISKLTVERVMSHPPITIEADRPVREAARVMLENKIAGLPVMEGGRLVGIITESDVFRMVVVDWHAAEASVPRKQ